MSETLSLPDTRVEYRDYPLVAAQPGIWIADQIALRRNGFAVAHYTELHGAIDRSALERAIRQGLAETRWPGRLEAIRRDPLTVIDVGHTPDGIARALAKANPQGRLVSPGEVADTVLWLASEGAAAITGQAIAVAGGEVMTG